MSVGEKRLFSQFIIDHIYIWNSDCLISFGLFIKSHFQIITKLLKKKIFKKKVPIKFNICFPCFLKGHRETWNTELKNVTLFLFGHPSARFLVQKKKSLKAIQASYSAEFGFVEI